jgi:hypothetical protein
MIKNIFSKISSSPTSLASSTSITAPILLALPSKENISNAINNILDKQNMLPKDISQEEKEKELCNDCNYFIEEITKAIHNGVTNEKTRVNINLDKNKFTHLKYISFENCLQYNDFKKSLKERDINIHVYKGNNEYYSIEYKILDKRVELYH